MPEQELKIREAPHVLIELDSFALLGSGSHVDAKDLETLPNSKHRLSNSSVVYLKH